MKTLIIKLGALGDVVRTTSILRALGDDVFWITEAGACEMLPGGITVVAVSDKVAVDAVLASEYDVVLSLDDELSALELVSRVRAERVVGAYIDEHGNTQYSLDMAGWFDMSLISRYGIETADTLKYLNDRSWQEYLYAALGKEFSGEEYLLSYESASFSNTNSVAIEARAGDRWPTKCWGRYGELAAKLEYDGYEVVWLTQRSTLKEYYDDIARCGAFIGGDTLGMHFALAARIPVVALFTCTSPNEIFGYGRMQKVISPLLKSTFYKKSYDAEAVNAISVDDVYRAFRVAVSN